MADSPLKPPTPPSQNNGTAPRLNVPLVPTPAPSQPVSSAPSSQPFQSTSPAQAPKQASPLVSTPVTSSPQSLPSVKPTPQTQPAPVTSTSAPVSTPKPPAPVVSTPSSAAPAPTVPPAQPPRPVTPQQPAAATTPQFSSRILQGAAAMSSQPFQDPGALKDEPVIPVTKPVLAGSPAPSALPVGSSGSFVPKEASTFTPAAGAPPKNLPSSRPSAIFEALKNPKLIIAGVILLLVIILGVVAMNFFGSSSETPLTPGSSTGTKTNKNVTLTYWGLWEPTEVMQSLITEYETNNPGVKISYIQQKSDQYRQRLQAALRDGTGPDLFRYHNTWMPMMKSDLSPAGKIFTADEMEKNYYPIMSSQLIQGGQVMGTPLMMDGLALVYNESMLSAANATPPRDWEQIRILASQLAVKNGSSLERGGIALGSTTNVDNFSDILGLMMLQNSANPGNPVTAKEQEALTFYTLFTRTDGVWNDTFPTSTVAFANEKVAMIIVPSWRLFEIQQLNPNLKFGVTRVPQLSGEQVAWGTYWVEGVSKASKNSEEAWKFLAFLSQAEQLRKFQTQATAVRGFGELYPRVDMADELKSNPLVSAYLDDALYAKSWYMASMTHDEGLNDKMIQYYTDAVNEMNARGNVEQALQTVLPGIQQVLSQYSISAETSTTP